MPTVLIVEDNEFNCDMLARRLERRGYMVITACDGADCLSKVADEPPDIILMDLSLPVINGWTATRFLKADHKYHQIPVIALTAHAMQGDCEKALASGCNAYETKPIHFSNLLSKMETLLA